MVDLVLVLAEAPHQFPRWLQQFASPDTVLRSPFPTSPAAFFAMCFLNTSYSGKKKKNVAVVSTCISLATWNSGLCTGSTKSDWWVTAPAPGFLRWESQCGALIGLKLTGLIHLPPCPGISGVPGTNLEDLPGSKARLQTRQESLHFADHRRNSLLCRTQEWQPQDASTVSY